MTINNINIFLLCIILEITKDEITYYKIKINNLRDAENLYCNSNIKKFDTQNNNYNSNLLEEEFNKLTSKFLLKYFLNYKLLYDEDFPFKNNEMNVLFIHFKEKENINNLEKSINKYLVKTLNFAKGEHVLNMNIINDQFNWSIIPIHLKIEIINEFNYLIDNLNNFKAEYLDINEFII